jgi:hypothetical protein
LKVPELRFDHLSRMSTEVGLFEHALFKEPRRDHGYCVDDVARGLILTSRQPEPSFEVTRLTGTYLRFLGAAQDGGGRFRNRRREDGSWADEAGTDDHWGRALWGLGTAAAASTDASVREFALVHASIGLQVRSPSVRATAYAAIGAFEVLRALPGDPGARALLGSARAALSDPGSGPSWPWPERRLCYANALLPEALLVIGAALADEAALDRGLSLLGWLLELQTRDCHLSMVPTAGWQLGEPQPGFDQQPIEVSALAEACTRALDLTGEDVWKRGLDLCVAWFLGSNDAGLAMYDPASGGAFDGLHAAGVNHNQGAESTLAALTTFQLARRVAAVAVP